MSDSHTRGRFSTGKSGLSVTVKPELLKILDESIREKYKLKAGEKTTGLRSREVERYIEEGLNRDKAIIRIAR